MKKKTSQGFEKLSITELREELLIRSRKNNIKKAQKGRFNAPRPFPEAKDTNEIADLLGITRAAVHQTVKRYGLTPVGGVKMRKGCITWWDPEDFRRAYLKDLQEDDKGDNHG